MAKEFAREFYHSKEWRKCRNSFFDYKHGICERCGGVGKIVHHKVYITPKNISDPYITLNFDYLELLCDSCHDVEHKNKQEYYFDDEGNIVFRN